jgi:hypothetical protein
VGREVNFRVPFVHRRHHLGRRRLEAKENAALVAYLSEITEKVIREEVHKETGEAEEVDEPKDRAMIKAGRSLVFALLWVFSANGSA